MREAIGEIRDGIREIAANTGKLAVLEERHAETRDGLVRAFDQIEALRISKCESSACRSIDDRVRSVEGRIPERLEDRLMSIEVDLPALKEVRKWVVAGISVVVGAVVVAVIGLVVMAPK